MLSLRNRLYKNCGIAFSNFGQVSTDKAVQADEEKGNIYIAYEKRSSSYLSWTTIMKHYNCYKLVVI